MPDALLLQEMPSYCAHEHWGSLAAIGSFAGGFRADIEPGALPTRRVGLLDLLLDPYFGGNLAASGADFGRIARAFGLNSLQETPADLLPQVWAALRLELETNLLSGTLQCLRRGMLALCSVDLQHAPEAEVIQLNEAVGERYNHMYAWYADAMERINLRGLIRPVHPAFYIADDTHPAAAAERRLTRTVMRIDPLLEMWQPEAPQRMRLAESLGIEPTDAPSWRRLIEALFERAAGRGAVGIKQLQAYSRPLAFEKLADTEVRFRGDFTPAEVKHFQDWVLHVCCEQANERQWPQQVHVGTHNLGQSNPLPLLDLARRYPRMHIVQLHCWPFLREAGWLAKQAANLYIDTCWLPILNPAYYREALQGWLNYVPLHKICCSHDATSVEMAAGSVYFVRTILGEVLRAQQIEHHLPDVFIIETAARLMHANAAALYRQPQPRGVTA